MVSRGHRGRRHLLEQAELTLRTSHREHNSTELFQIEDWQQKKMSVQMKMGRGGLSPCVVEDISK